jgi:hypothetical protein
MARLIIFHKSCWDGFCAAWLCHLAWPDAEFMPAHNDWTPPDVTGKDVLIADVCFSREHLLRMKRQAASLVVLDHHETAQKDMGGLDFCVFDINHSGARLTWDYLVREDVLPPNLLRPWLVDYVEDRDLWKKKLQGTDAVNAYLRNQPLDFAVWDSLACRDPWSLIEPGSVLLKYQQGIIDHHLRYLQWVQIGDLKGKGVSCSTAHIWSEIIACGYAEGARSSICDCLARHRRRN